MWLNIGLCLATVAVYLPSLDNELVYDDAYLVEKDPRVYAPGHLDEIWITDYWLDEGRLTITGHSLQPASPWSTGSG